MDDATTEYLFRGPRSTPEDIAVPYGKEGHVMYARHTRSVNVGRSVVHTGGRFDSHLVVPVLPPRG
jgi:hypothetical protein